MQTELDIEAARQMVKRLLVELELYKKSLHIITSQFFPKCCVVKVTMASGQVIFGIVTGNEHPGQLSCYVESGNVWNYSFDQLERVSDVRQWPRWVRDTKLRWLRGTAR